MLAAILESRTRMKIYEEVAKTVSINELLIARWPMRFVHTANTYYVAIYNIQASAVANVPALSAESLSTAS